MKRVFYFVEFLVVLSVIARGAPRQEFQIRLEAYTFNPRDPSSSGMFSEKPLGGSLFPSLDCLLFFLAGVTYKTI